MDTVPIFTFDEVPVFSIFRALITVLSIITLRRIRGRLVEQYESDDTVRDVEFHQCCNMVSVERLHASGT